MGKSPFFAESLGPLPTQQQPKPAHELRAEKRNLDAQRFVIPAEVFNAYKRLNPAEQQAFRVLLANFKDGRDEILRTLCAQFAHREVKGGWRLNMPPMPARVRPLFGRLSQININEFVRLHNESVSGEPNDHKAN